MLHATGLQLLWVVASQDLLDDILSSQIVDTTCFLSIAPPVFELEFFFLWVRVCATLLISCCMQQSHCPTLGATNVMLPPGGPETVGRMFLKKIIV